MTCVLGMVVSREIEIRNFVKTKYYKLIGKFGDNEAGFDAEWKVNENSVMYSSPKLYNESGFKKEEEAKQFIQNLQGKKAIITNLKKSKQKENAPLASQLAPIPPEITQYPPVPDIFPTCSTQSDRVVLKLILSLFTT